MKRQLTFALFAVLIAALFAGNVSAQFGDLMNKAKSKIDKSQKKVERTTQTADPNQTAQTNNDSNNNSGAMKQTGARKPGETGFIGFAKKPIDPNNLGAAQFTNNFANGEPIYGVAYLPQPLSKYLNIGDMDVNKKDTIFAMFYTESEFGSRADDEPKEFPLRTDLQARIIVSNEMMNQKVVTFAVFPDPKLKITASEGRSGYNNVKYFVENSYTEARKYDLQLRFTVSGTDDFVASAPISIDFSNKAPYLAMQKTYNKSMADVMIGKAGDNEMPKSAMNNPAFEKQFAALLQGQLGATKVLKMIIISPSWQITHNEITERIVNRYLATRSVVREEEGYCRTRYALMVQDYNGSGYGKTYAAGTTGDTTDYVVDCAKVK